MKNDRGKSYIFAIVGAEYILRWLPIGTHDWNMFVKPDDLIKICKKNSLHLDEILGVKYNVLSRDWYLSENNDVNALARRKYQFPKNVEQLIVDYDKKYEQHIIASTS